mgnify:CR=1 FL=1
MSEKKPTKVFRAGGIQAAVWEKSQVKDGQTVTRYTIKLSKSFIAHGEWKSTDNFWPDELPKVALVTNEAYRFLKLTPSSQEQ